MKEVKVVKAYFTICRSSKIVTEFGNDSSKENKIAMNPRMLCFSGRRSWLLRGTCCAHLLEPVVAGLDRRGSTQFTARRCLLEMNTAKTSENGGAWNKGSCSLDGFAEPVARTGLDRCGFTAQRCLTVKCEAVTCGEMETSWSVLGFGCRGPVARRARRAAGWLGLRNGAPSVGNTGSGLIQVWYGTTFVKWGKRHLTRRGGVFKLPGIKVPRHGNGMVGPEVGWTPRNNNRCRMVGPLLSFSALTLQCLWQFRLVPPWESVKELPDWSHHLFYDIVEQSNQLLNI